MRTDERSWLHRSLEPLAHNLWARGKEGSAGHIHRVLAEYDRRTGCDCTCCDHSERSDCGCRCHVDGRCAAAPSPQEAEPPRGQNEQAWDDLRADGGLPESHVEPCGHSVAPAGWWCSRRKGHEGPCAAYPDLDAAESAAPSPQENEPPPRPDVGGQVTTNERRAWFVYEAARLENRAAGRPINPEPWEERDAAFRENMIEAVAKQCACVDAYVRLGWRYEPVEKDWVFFMLCEIAARLGER